MTTLRVDDTEYPETGKADEVLEFAKLLVIHQGWSDHVAWDTALSAMNYFFHKRNELWDRHYKGNK